MRPSLDFKAECRWRWAKDTFTALCKGIQPHGVGLLGGLYPDLPQALQRTRPYGDTEAAQNVLVIPMQNVHGKILSCQFIAEHGSKTYTPGSKQKGGFFFIRGVWRQPPWYQMT